MGECEEVEEIKKDDSETLKKGEERTMESEVLIGPPVEKEKIWFAVKMEPVVATCTSFGIALPLSLTPYWQLALLAGFAGGLICRKMKCGALSGFGVAAGWLVNFLYKFTTTQSWVVLDQVGGAIFSSSGLGWVVLILACLIGAILGFLGGAIGSGVRILLLGNVDDAKNSE
ncbi:MAG: hypothetical protein ACTSU5_04925 [Promethearchaeota archaeon]